MTAALLSKVPGSWTELEQPVARWRKYDKAFACVSCPLHHHHQLLSTKLYSTLATTEAALQHRHSHCLYLHMYPGMPWNAPPFHAALMQPAHAAGVGQRPAGGPGH